LQALPRTTFIALSFFVSIFGFAQGSPEDISGLEMWLDAGIGTTLDGSNKVTDWEDLSGNGHSATQGAGTLRPLWVDDVLNGHPVVRMDGANDFMAFSEVNNARTIFWVIKEEATASANFRCLLGHSEVFDFLRGPENNIWHPDFTSTAIQEGITRSNYSEIDGTVTIMPDGFALVSVQATGNTRANQLTVDRALFARVWHGDIAEIIIYNEPLSQQDFDWVENFLADKYTPEFFIDDDVNVDYGFCDTTICAAPGFQSYLWSNDESTECISVNADGAYVCTVTDVFNREQSDTVNVSFPGDLDFGVEIVICEDSTIVLNTNLSLEEYTFEWQDGSSDSIFQVTTGGEYSVTVTDTDLCSATSVSANISVDQFGSIASISSQSEMCIGDSVYLLAPGFEVQEYTWSDESSMSSLTIISSGEYWVEAIDFNGCATQDTVEVTVVGQNPDVIFDFVGQCQMEVISIAQTSLDVDIHTWFVDGEEVSELSEFENTFSEAGEYLIELLAENNEGCSSERDSLLIIHPRPTAEFDHTLACEDSEITFFSLSQVETGLIQSYDWLIDGASEEGFQVFTSFEDPGSIDVQHNVLTDRGCYGEVVSSVEILPNPELVFSQTGICLGDLTQFQIDIIDNGAGTLDDFFWDFGDNTNSFDPEPLHLYSFAGTYEVTVDFIGENECLSSQTQELEIFYPPFADFEMGIVCAGNPTEIDPNLDLGGADLVNIEWFIDGESQLVGDTIATLVFSESGESELGLEISTEQGCDAFESMSVEIQLSPQPEILATPAFGSAPLDVFLMTDEEGINHVWDFGDFSTGLGSFVEHTYTEDGVYTAQLNVTDVNGCYGTAEFDIVVNDLVSDLIVSDVLCSENGQQTVITILVENQGNYPIWNMELQWWIGNDSPISEFWQGEILPGEFTQYSFMSSPNAGQSNYGFVCASAADMTVSLVDQTPDNNIACKLLQTPEDVLLYPPFPNPADEELNFNVGSNQIRDVVINVFDDRGRLVIRANLLQLQSGLNMLKLDVSELNTGIYALEIQWDSNSATQNFMISRSD